jgi:hypothetical protein
MKEARGSRHDPNEWFAFAAIPIREVTVRAACVPPSGRYFPIGRIDYPGMETMEVVAIYGFARRMGRVSMNEPAHSLGFQ